MSFSLSNISGSQIQKDSFVNSLTVACDPGLVAPKTNSLTGLPNSLNLEKRDGKSAIAVDICCLDLACLNVTEKLTVNDATFNTITTAFLTANNANIDTLEGRVVNLKASNAVGAPGGAAKLTIGDTAAGDAMGGDTAIEIVGTNPSVNAIDLSTGGDITLKPQGAGPLNTSAPPDLTVYISSGGSGQPSNISGPNNLYDIQPTGGGTGAGGQVAVTTDASGVVTALVASVGGAGYVVGETYETASAVPPANPLPGAIEFVLPATSVDGPPGGILRAYQIEAQFISGSIQGQPLVFAPNLTQINGVTQATSNAAPLNVNYLEISNGSGAPGAIVGAGNTTGTPDAGGNIINILNPVFIESQTNQGLQVAGGIQAGSGPAFAGAYGFQVSNQGVISAPSATITGVVQTETLNVNGSTTLGDGVGVDTLTVNAASTFNDEVTINNVLTVFGTSELANTDINGTLTQTGSNVTLAGATTISNTLLVTGLLTANAGLTVNNVLLTANAGLTVSGGLLTANAGLTVSGGLLTANAGLTVSGGLLTANAGLTVSGLTTLNAATTINADLTAETTTTGELTVGIPLGTPLMTVAPNGNINTTGNITASLNITTLLNIKGSFIESTGGLLVGGISTLTGNVIVNSLTGSTSPASGALTVAGGVGIGANLNTGGAVKVGAALTVADDTILNGALEANGTVDITDTTGSTSPASGALTVAGGVGIAENLSMGGELTVDSITSNVGSGLVILPATGQNVNIQPSGVGSEVNITGSNIGITSGFKVANTGTMAPPVSGTSTGVQGDIRWGTAAGITYLYICIAANTWRRAALSPF